MCNLLRAGRAPATVWPFPAEAPPASAGEYAV